MTLKITQLDKVTFPNDEDLIMITQPSLANLGSKAITVENFTNVVAVSASTLIDKYFIGLGAVANVNTSTTANITDSVDKRFVTDASLVIIQSVADTSGHNTGDQNLAPYLTIANASNVYQPIGNYLTEEVDPVFVASNAFNLTASHLLTLNNTSGVNTGNQDLSGLVVNTTTVNGHALSGNITVSKSDVGLGAVTNVDTSITSNIVDSTNKRFVTDIQLAVVANVSGVNTGDQDLSGYVESTTCNKITVSITAPVNPAVNDIWIDLN